MNRPDALSCWQHAHALFPLNEVVLNELGNVYGRAGRYEQAAESYRQGAEQGSLLAELNLAHMLELQGFWLESKQGYQDALEKGRCGCGRVGVGR